MSMSLGQADKTVQKLWDKDANAWETRWVPIFRKFARDLILDSKISSGQIVLDIGTGTGIASFDAAKWARPEGFVVGIDRSKSMLAVAKAGSADRRLKNIRFIVMDGERLLFPDSIFDVVTSNCGIFSVGFHQTVAEVFRVLRRGGIFVYNEWHLNDVPVHRIFSEILLRHRTKNPSRKLRIQRVALAALERFGNREMNLNAQVRELRREGFKKVEVKPRNYKIALHGIEGYLDMRLERATLRQELAELSAAGREKLLYAFKDGLRQFVRHGRFLFDWKVTFVRAKKT